MKLTAILLTITCLQLSAKSFSQTISFSGRNVPLEKVLSTIEKQSGYYLFYKYNELKDARPVTLQLRNASVDEALKQSFAGQPFRYAIDANTIIITKATQVATSEISLQKDIRGRVTDDTGEPLPGASIRVKGTNQATVSDVNGAFRLGNVGDNAVLVVSFTGFIPQEIQVNAQTEVSIRMKEELLNLNEVVVVGYGTQKRINLTGSVSSIKADDIQSRPVTSVNAALQGQMAGVTIVNTNARPGTNNASIRIRGIGTLNNANPLIVIDGIPGGDMSILNPDDVESVSVLKDAASASIYGVRGANGVVLVTTKKGRSAADGKVNVRYNGYVGLQTPTALPKMASSVEYMELMNEALLNSRSNPSWTDEQIAIAREGSDQNYYANTNWIDEIYKNSAPQHNHNLSLNGGIGQSSYYLSYGYLNQGGLITGDNFNSNRNNLRLRFNTKVFDRLNIDGNVGYVDRNYISSSEGTATSSGPLNAAMAISPLVPVRFTTGGWAYHGGQRNPIAMTTDAGDDKFDSQEFTGNIQATLKLFDGLQLRGQYGQVRYHTRRTIFNKTVDYIDPNGTLVYQNNVPNKLEVRSFTRNYNTLLGMLEYEKTLSKDHYIKAMVAASQEEDINNDLNASRTDLPVNDVPSLNVGTLNQLNSNPATQWALQSFFGRFNYAYKEKYLLEGNFRRDGSSRFDASLRWDWFGSLSAGWIFTEESFFPESLKEILNVGKVRFSYGTQGNDQVGGNFDYMSIYESRTTMPIGNQLTSSYWQPGVANQYLTWESVEKSDIGVDLALFNSRLNITADYYLNKTKDILLAVPLPDVLGAAYPVQNAGSVENKGWELQAGWRSKVRNLTYGITANLADVKNKVTSYGGAPPVIGDRLRRVGDPIDAFYGLVADRIAQEADFNYNPATGSYTPRFPHIAGDPISPGDIIYKVLTPTTDPGKPYDITDPEREYISLDKDRKVIGNAIPRYTYGFRGDLAWKGIDFSFFLQGVGKINGLLQGQARHAFINQGTMPQKVHLDRWTPDNPDASYPRLVYNQSYNTRLSTFWLQDASYLRLKNIQLGYTLPKKITNLLKIEDVRIYASADNLFTSTDFFYGFDPEIPVSSGGIYPQVKTFIFGLNINLK